MFLVVFYSKLLLYNDLGGYNAESLAARVKASGSIKSFSSKKQEPFRVLLFRRICNKGISCGVGC